MKMLALAVASFALWWLFLWIAGRWIFNHAKEAAIIDRRIAQSKLYSSEPAKFPVRALPAARAILADNLVIEDGTHFEQLHSGCSKFETVHF